MVAVSRTTPVHSDLYLAQIDMYREPSPKGAAFRNSGRSNATLIGWSSKSSSLYSSHASFFNSCYLSL